jgi:penicillin-binding protein 1A
MTNINNSKFISLIKLISKIFGVKLVDDFDKVTNDAILSYKELERLRINYSNLLMLVVLIEEKNYFKNSGFVCKPMLRACLSRFLIFRKILHILPSGGSTIQMQLARTLYINSYKGKYTRKFIEILLAIWFNRNFNKDEILRIYVTSVRFERKVFGLASALNYFFKKRIKNNFVTIEESFFLTERLSNISSSVNWKRINNLLRRVSVDIPLDTEKLKQIYFTQISNKKLIIK